MKVFISWSGPRSQHIAEALHAWLPLVLLNVEPWVSRHDIDAGARWSAELDETLKGTDYGIIVLTPGHIDKSWLMYEAGSLGKRVEASHVVPYCYGLEPVEVPPGPLTRFQGVAATEAGTRKLIESLAAALIEAKEKAPSLEQRNEMFEQMWPKLKTKLGQTPTEKAAVVPPPSSDDMIKEILTIVRGIERARDDSPSSLNTIPKLQTAKSLQAEYWRQAELLRQADPPQGPARRDVLLMALTDLAANAVRGSRVLQNADVRLVRVTRSTSGTLRVMATIDGQLVAPQVADNASVAFENQDAFRVAVVDALTRELTRVKENGPAEPFEEDRAPSADTYDRF